MDVGILICGKTYGNIGEKFGDYGKIYKDFLLLSERCKNFRFKYYNCYDGEFPNKDDIEVCHFFMLTGSAYSSYENLEWIHQLKDLVRTLDKIKKKMVGICFGHQIIAEALGCKVIPHPKGWEVSVCPLELNNESEVLFQKKTEYIKRLYIYQMHKDIVKSINKESGLKIFCHNKHCKNQGFIKEKHILTFQGHPEYCSEIIKVFLNKRRNIMGEEVYNRGMKYKDVSMSKKLLLDMILNFVEL